MNNNNTSKNEFLLQFFTHELSRIFYSKQYLLSKLPHLMRCVQAPGLNHTLANIGEDIHRQMTRIELIHALLEQPIQKEISCGIHGLLEDAYQDIESKENIEVINFFVIYYMQIAEMMEMASFELLEMIAVKLDKLQIQQLMKQNFEEIKETRTILLLMAASSITG